LKKKRYIQILAIALAGMMVSCEKTNIAPNFFIGDDSLVEMSWYAHMNIHAAYGNQETMELDVNGDGEADLVFFSFAQDSAGEGDKRGSSVWAANKSVEIGYLASAEDLFSMAKTVDGQRIEYIYNERSHFYCEECQDLGRHNETFFTSPAIFLQGDSLGSNIEWSTYTHILSNFDQSKVQTGHKNNGPIFNYIVSGFWATVEHGYMVFRIKEGLKNYRYGWLKMSVTDHRAVNISEMGVQKDL